MHSITVHALHSEEFSSTIFSKTLCSVSGETGIKEDPGRAMSSNEE